MRSSGPRLAVNPIAYWLASAFAALRAEIPALLKGPREQRVIWDVQRE